MSLFETINNDIKNAMLAKDAVKLAALRSVKSAFLLEKTSKGGGGDIPADVELKIIQKLVKQRKESAEMYKNNGRNDLYENEIAEALILEGYLPEQLSEEKIIGIVKSIIDKTGAESMKDMGKVMGLAGKELSGKADGKTISDIVKKLLS